MNRLTTRPGRAGYSLLALLGLLSLADPPTVAGSDPRGVSWRADLGSAQAEAKSRGLPLWVQFTGPWCPNCRRMDRGAFLDPLVVAASRDRFVPVKLRADEYESLALSLGLSSLPATVIVRPTGQVVDKWEGYGDAEVFLAFLESTLARDDRAKKEAQAEKAEVALASYCPVSLVERRQLVEGRHGVQALHDGVEYRFADESSRIAFLARPEKYVPANRGVCPVGQVDGGVFRPGHPRFGVLYRGHLFLCSDAADRDRFVKNPERYANVELAVANACPHCWAEKAGRQEALAQGRPAPSTATRKPRISPPPALLEALLAPVSRLRR